MSDTKPSQNDDLLMKDEESPPMERKSQSRGSGSSTSRRHSSTARPSASSSSKGGRRSSSTTSHSSRSPTRHSSPRRSSTTRSSGRSHKTPDSKIKEDEKQKLRLAAAVDGSSIPSPPPLTSPGAIAINHSSSSSSHRRSKETPDSKIKDDKQKLRLASGVDGGSSLPGVQAEKASSRPTKRDAKAKERRTSRATKPGAEVSTSSSSKKSKSDSSFDAIEPEQSPRSDIVDAAEFARRNQELEAEIQSMKADLAEQEKNVRKAKKRKLTTCIAFVFVLIWAGVATYFAGQDRSSSDAVNQGTSQETLSSSVTPSNSPSFDPAHNPSTAPSLSEQKYPKPSREECDRIARGLKIPGEDEMFESRFGIPMEVTLEPGNDIDPLLLTDLQVSIEELLVPDLIGCSRSLFQLRRLASVSMRSDHRDLQDNKGIRWAIAKAIVEGTVNSGACEYSSSPDCTVVTATMVLRVRGEERIVDLAPILELIFPFTKDIQPDLQLGSPFASVVVAAIKPLGDETASPTIAPTGTGSVSPSGFPSYNPSTSPTSAPAIGPTTPAPTIPPTKFPSMAPSTSPSVAPTPTPRPTLAPQPGPSPPPTRLPSKSPSSSPSKIPSRSPSTNPSPEPSDIPSSEPSLASSSSPTIEASATPSSAPTNAPRLGFVPLLRQGMHTEQSSDLQDLGPSRFKPPSYSLNGDYIDFAHTDLGSNQWWKVQVSDYYGQPVTINQVTIWNAPFDCSVYGDDCQERLAGATVKLFGEGDTLLATSSPLTAAMVQTVDFGEVSGVQWVQVIQSSKFTYLHFAEIEAWGSIPNDVNHLGYNGLLQEAMVTEQSSQSSFHPSFSLNGNFNDFAHTDLGSNQWWRVLVSDYYGQSVTVNKVTIWNRSDDCMRDGSDFCQARLVGATVKLFGEGDTLLATSSPLSAAMIQTVDFGEVTGVEWVQVIQESKFTYLHFAEIEVWGKLGAA